MTRRRRDERKDARRFGIALCLLLVVVFAGLSLWKGHPQRAAAFAGAGVLALALALFAMPVWLPIFRAWSKVGHAISVALTNVILVVFYYLAMSPFCVLLRMLGKARFETAWGDGRSSYWLPKTPVARSIERYRRLY